MLKKFALLALLLPISVLAQTAVSGTKVQDGTGTGTLLTSGTWCFSSNCLTVTAGAFSGSVTAGTQTVTVVNASSATILTVPSVTIGSSAFSWDTFVVPTNATISGTGSPSIACAPGAIYTQTNNSNLIWTCVSYAGQNIWASAVPTTPAPSGFYAGVGVPTFTCTVPCTYQRTDVISVYAISGPSGTSSGTWANITSSLPASALFLGSNSGNQAVAATTGNLSTFLAGLTGCGTAGYAYVPKDGQCEAALPTATAAGQVPVSTGAGTTYSAVSTALNLLSYGAVGDERDCLDGVTTASSPTLTSATCNFSTADNSRKFLVSMGTQGVYTGIYVSGITATGSTNSTCKITALNGGGSSAIGWVALTGTNTIATNAQINFTPNFGTGYTSAPTSGTASSGGPLPASSCSGTATITSSLVTYPVLTTATYVNSTTVTLGTNATTSGTNVFVSIGTDNTTAVQNWLTACANTGGGCYLPQGQFAVTGALTIPSAMNLFGDGAGPVWGSGTLTGWGPIYPAYAPYLSGSVLVSLGAGDDVLDITTQGGANNLSNFGVRYAPPIAFWDTGHAINATATVTRSGHPVWDQVNAKWIGLRVFGNDGNHYAYQLTNASLGTYIDNASYGGGGLNWVSNTLFCCTGNAIVAQQVVSDGTGGTSNAINFPGGSNNNLMTFIRPNAGNYAVTYSDASSPLASWPIPPPWTTNYSCYTDNLQGTLTILAADCEGTTAFPTTRSDYWNIGQQGMFFGTWEMLQIPSSNDMAIGIQHGVAGMMRLGTGTIESSGTVPTLSGCGTPTATGGSTVGKFTAGSTTCTVTMTVVGTAQHGNDCTLTDLTTPADLFAQTGETTTTCTVTGTVSSGDIIHYKVFAY